MEFNVTNIVGLFYIEFFVSRVYFSQWRFHSIVSSQKGLATFEDSVGLQRQL